MEDSCRHCLLLGQNSQINKNVYRMTYFIHLSLFSKPWVVIRTRLVTSQHGQYL